MDLFTALRSTVAGMPAPDPRSPDSPEFASADLAKAIRQNRLEGPALDRIESGAWPWAGKELRAELEAAAIELRSDFERATAVALRFQQAYPGGKPPIVLKGAVAHLLTDGASPLRRSNDLDLIASDPDTAAAVLRAQGFEQLQANLGVHEAAKLSDGRTLIDLHHGIPVRTFTNTPGMTEVWDGSSSVDIDPRGEVRTTVHNLITYEDVLAESTTVTLNGGTLRVTGLPLTVLASLMHMHRDYLERWWPRPLATIRLGELASVRDLLIHPAAEPARVAALAGVHAAESAVEFGRWLLDDLLGFRSPIPSTGRTAGHGRRFWGDEAIPIHCTSPTPLEDPRHLVVRDLEFGAYVRALNGPDKPLPVPLQCDGSPSPAVIVSTEVERPTDHRMIISGAGLGRFHGSLVLRRTDSALSARITIAPDGPSNPNIGEFTVILHFGDTTLECAYEPATGRMQRLDRGKRGGLDHTVSDDVRMVAASASGVHTITMTAPWHRIRGVRPDGDLPILFVSGRKVPEESRPTAVIVPLVCRTSGPE